MKIYSFRQRLPSWMLLAIGIGFFAFGAGLSYAQSGPLFEDVSRIDRSYVAIQVLADRDIVKGVSEGVFAPQRGLNRAEATTLILRYLQEDVLETEIQSSSFSDVNSGSWYASIVEQALDLGLVQGNQDGTFAPERQLNQVEFLAMLTRADQVNLSPFTLEGGQWYDPLLEYGLQAGILSSKEDPGKLVNREKAAQMLYLSLLLQEKENSQVLAAYAQLHLSSIEPTVAANELAVATYHADLAVKLMDQVMENTPEDNVAGAQQDIAQGYWAWVKSILAALEEDPDLALIHINTAIDSATSAYFKDEQTQALGSHLKDIACNVYEQVGEGQRPEDCVGRLSN